MTTENGRMGHALQIFHGIAHFFIRRLNGDLLDRLDVDLAVVKEIGN